MEAISAKAPAREGKILRVALTSLAGASIEFYDLFIYATAAALVFPALFFPGFSPLAGTLVALATFSSAFVVRPLGGVVFGHFGDRVGRKKALVVALLLMGVATTAIGLLPTYSTIGIAAPFLLAALRLVQGFAVGGQWGAVVLMATESAPNNKRGFYGSFAQLGLPAGIFLANGVFLVLLATLSREQLLAWGWRIPFLLSVVLIGVALYAHKRLEDTPAFQRVKETRSRVEHRSPVVEVLRRRPKQVLLAAGAMLASSIVGYISAVYVLTHATQVLRLPQSTVLVVVTLAVLTWIPGVLFFAWLSDKIGRRKMFLAGAALLGVWVAYPFFRLIDTGSVALIFVSLVVGAAFQNMMYGPQAALFSEMFSTQVRYSGASLGYQLGILVGGALAPLIATSLYAATSNSLYISLYMALACLITFACVLLITETYGKDITEVVRERDMD